MQVRPEEPADVDAVRGVHLAAFATLEPGAAPAVEARLTDALRDGGHLLPALTLVAVEAPDLALGDVAHRHAARHAERAVRNVARPGRPLFATARRPGR